MLLMQQQELGGGGFDPDYQAVLDYASANAISHPSTPIKEAQNNLMIALKASVFLASRDILYITSQDGSEDFQFINWVDPYNFSGIGGSGAYGLDGFSPKDSNSSYTINTGYVPINDAVKFEVNSGSIGYKTSTPTETSDLWSSGDTIFYTSDDYINLRNGTLQRYNVNNTQLYDNMSTIGSMRDENTHHTFTFDSNVGKVVKNGVVKTSKAFTGSGLSPNALIIGKCTGAFNDKFQYTHIGAHLTLAQIQQFESDFNDYLTEVGYL